MSIIPQFYVYIYNYMFIYMEKEKNALKPKGKKVMKPLKVGQESWDWGWGHFSAMHAVR